MNLTIAYFTSRKDCRIEWFLNSLTQQEGFNEQRAGGNLKVVVVDFHHDKDREKEFKTIAHDAGFLGMYFVHIEPKPSVWQGKHKLTKQDWFAPSSARNTSLCHAPDGHIAFVDDLSVLMPGWLNIVRDAMTKNWITLGAYKKVKNLKVENGIAVSYDEFPAGVDSRWDSGRSDRAVTAAGGWMFGCSLVAPVEAFLTIGGWPEALCDGLGSEDYIAGIMLEKAGYEFVYDRRMLTLESEELHYVGPQMIRKDFGVSPNDKSHAVLNMAMGGMKYHPNYFGEGGIRKLRESILAGGEFPIVGVPEHEWWTKTPLKDL